MRDPSAPWPGFYKPRYTPVPDDFFDVLAPDLTEGELRVLLYIMRHTFGFKKDADRISIKQMVDGIVARDGTRQDRGTGMGRPAVTRSVKALAARGVIIVTRSTTEQGDQDVNVYELRLREGVASEENHPRFPKKPAVVSQGSDGVVSEENPQETDQQETPEQDGAWKAELRDTLTPANYARWVEPLVLGMVLNGAAVLVAPDAQTADYATRRLLEPLKRALGVDFVAVQARR